jgi:hypothetical protein
MASWDDVRRLAMALPEATERSSYGGATAWSVKDRGKDRGFVWERPLGKKDRADLGDAAPDGPILAAHVSGEDEKHALIADNPAVFFTIPHFNGYPAVLIRLDHIDVDELAEVVTEAWLLRAPKRLTAEWEREHGHGDAS